MHKNIQEISKILLFTQNIINNLDKYTNLFHKIYPNDLKKEQIKDKLIAETTLLLFITNRLHEKYGLSSLILDIAKSIEKNVRSPKHLQTLSNNPQTVVGVGLGHIMLNKLGLINDDFNDVIKTAFSSKFVHSIERQNFRQMEVEWLNGLFYDKTPDFSNLLASSILTKPLHSLYMRRNDAYACYSCRYVYYKFW